MESVVSTIEGKELKLESHDGILNSWTCHTGQAAFILSGPITSKEKAEAYYETAKQFDAEFKKRKDTEKYPLRLVVCHLGLPDSEWDQMAKEHLWLTWLQHEYGLSAQMKYLVLPTPSPTETMEKENEFFHKAIERLTLLHNLDVWEAYCFWMTEEIEIALSKALLDALDFYTLEAHFKDFIIEERTNILRHIQLGVSDTILKLGTLRKEITFPLNTGDDVFTLEKHLMKARSEAKQRLIQQYHSLQEMVRIIDVIEQAHPDLLSIKRKALLLSQLLGSHLEIAGHPPISWSQQLMLMQLLHEEFSIISALNCDTGLERTHLAFAVQLAISLLKQSDGVDEAIELALHVN